MTCGGCIAKAKSELLKIGEIIEAEVTLQAPQARLTMKKHVPLSLLQTALSKAGTFTITEADGEMHKMSTNQEPVSWDTTYKPVLIIGGYLLGVTLLLDIRNGSLNNWMPHFMGSFFLVFSFFKFLDLKGFAESYVTYDIIAK